MADEPTITDQLQQITDAKLHSSYEGAIGRDVSVARAFSKKILALNPEQLFPPVGQIPRQNYVRNQPNPRASFRDRVMNAYVVTNQLVQALSQMSAEPGDGNQRARSQENLWLCLGEFVDTWSTLFPALQAAAGVSDLDRVRHARDEIERDEKAIKNILASAQEAVKEIGAAKHAKEFARLAEGYEKKAAEWLRYTLYAVAVFFLVVVASGIWAFTISNDYGKLVQVVVGKVLLLGVLYYLVVLCSRTYRANAHLAAVNLHRATALQVFETFVNSPSDEQTKNAILLETTRCIYSHTSTGFLSGEDPSSPIQVVEILKALGPKGTQG